MPPSDVTRIGTDASRASEALRPYVPRIVIDWLRHTPDERSREVEGTLAFADISGFTRLTERLSRLGRVGAEEMSDTLDGTFGRLLGVAYADGAQLLKWGGDAVLLFFDGDDHAARACHAAYGMRATIREIGRLRTQAGSVELRISTGIHSGTFQLYLVGSPEHHRELIVCGPGVTAAVGMESFAGAAGIAITAQTAALIDRRLATAEDGYHLLRAQPPVTGAFTRPVPDVSGVDLAHCLPRSIREHLLAAAGESEHRTISVAFVGFSGTDDLLGTAGAATLGDALDGLVTNVQDAARRYGVTFFESDIDKNGGKIMLTAGAPTSGGLDEDRILRMARLVVDRAGPLPVRIGINRGNVFAGDFGPPYRRTYSIKGDAVNVAARLMGKATVGHIIASAAVVERARSPFEARALEPLALKGKSVAVRAFELGAAASQAGVQSTDARLVGRESELAILLHAWADAREGEGKLVDVVGEPGIGKSSLVSELTRRATGATVLRATADPYETSTPYFVWKTLLRELVGADDESALATRILQLAPELAPWLPLIAIPMGIEAGPTDATTDLDERYRKPRLEEATAALVYAALAGPTLIVLDDVHLMDEPSADLLKRLHRDLERNQLLLVVTRRDQETGYVPGAGPEVMHMALRPLGEEASASLLEGVAGETALRPDERATLVRRAAGNPLFLKELVAAAAVAGSVAGLPDSIEGVIASQIDRLEPRDRTILRYASVLGTTFTRRLLRTMLGTALARVPATLDAYLTADTRDTLRFQHALIRDAAYEGLPFRRRKELHGRAGDAIEAATKNPDEQAELLSMHYFHAARFDKAWQYSVTAGARARAQYANPEAAEFYARAVDAVRHIPSITSGALVPVLQSLGDVRFLVGQSSAAVSAYKEARTLSRGVPLKEAELVRNLARSQMRQGRFAQTLRLVTQGRNLLEGLESDAATAMRATLAAYYAVCRYRQGNLRDAMPWARTAVSEAEASGDRAAQAIAYQAVDAVYQMSGLTPDRPYDRLALRLFEASGDLKAQAQMLNNMAVGAIFKGQWVDALDMFRRARDVYARVGDATSAGSAGHNMGELLTAQARFEEAEPILRESMRVAKAVGDRETAAADLKQLGRAAAYQGRFDEALRLLEQARAEATAMGSAHEIADTEAAIAECKLLAGDVSAALRGVAVALDHAEQARATRVLPTLARVRGFALMHSGMNSEAKDAFDDAVRLSAEPGTQLERALALAGLSRLADRAGEHERARALASESQEMLDSLGVVSAPMLLAEVDDVVNREVEVEERVAGVVAVAGDVVHAEWNAGRSDGAL